MIYREWNEHGTCGWLVGWPYNLSVEAFRKRLHRAVMYGCGLRIGRLVWTCGIAVEEEGLNR